MKALIGHTGFVGGNLVCQMPFDDLYNSRNIDDIRGRSYELLVCAGAPGSKWRANENPREDWATISRLLQALHHVEARRVVLISTVDVYAKPQNVDEGTRPTTKDLHWYGINRLMLELRLREEFGERLLIVRLPALFGPGLKKNALYDLMTGTRLDEIAPNAVYQWYPLARLGSDIDLAIERRLTSVNLVSAPLPIERLRRRFFPNARIGKIRSEAPVYGVRSRHKGFYLSGREIMAEIERFLAQPRQSASEAA